MSSFKYRTSQDPRSNFRSNSPTCLWRTKLTAKIWRSATSSNCKATPFSPLKSRPFPKKKTALNSTQPRKKTNLDSLQSLANLCKLSKSVLIQGQAFWKNFNKNVWWRMALWSKGLTSYKKHSRPLNLNWNPSHNRWFRSARMIMTLMMLTMSNKRWNRNGTKMKIKLSLRKVWKKKARKLFKRMTSRLSRNIHR